MKLLFKCGRIGFLFVTVLCFLVVGCEKPKLKNGDAISESPSEELSPAVAEKTVETAVPEKPKPKAVEKKKNSSEVQRVVAEKRMPEPGEGALPAKKKEPEPLNNSRALDIKYPIARTLIDYQGQKKTPADIIGRDAASITVILKSDGKRIDIPVSELSKPDQTFVSFLPLKAPPPVKKVLPKPAYLVFREKDLANLRNQAKAMRQDMVRNRKKLLIVRGIKGRLKIVEQNIREVEQEITIYKVTHGIVD